jgi:hypothetical protein
VFSFSLDEVTSEFIGRDISDPRREEDRQLNFGDGGDHLKSLILLYRRRKSRLYA